MRFDSVGLFWQDLPSKNKKGEVIRPMPTIPETGWQPPKDFPNLSCADVLAIDTETFDPELRTAGPGWSRNQGHIVGVSIATVEGYKWYFPVRHTVEPEYNMNPSNVFAWLADTLNNKKCDKVGANLMYDIGWLRTENVHVCGKLYDVQFAEALLAEAARVDLDVLGEKYLHKGKETNVLYQWLADFYGGKPTSDQRKNIYRSTPRLAGPYAESDATLPLQIIPKQLELLRAEGLYDLFDMECRLIPLLIEMRYQGVRVNLSKAEELYDDFGERVQNLHKKVEKMAGCAVNVNSSDTLARAFDNNGLSYPKTKKGSPSFVKTFLENHPHELPQAITEMRKYEKLRGTFIKSYILESHVNGRVHCQFHPLRGESGGTRSGRFSSSNPNLQNIPSRDEELAPLVRGLFMPDEGHVAWRKYDYSQIEYRYLAHYAVGPGSDLIRQMYADDPDTDYHEALRMEIKNKTGKLIDRKPAKTINFGMIYGMGVPKLTRSLGLTQKQGKDLFKAYHDGAPFVAATMDATMQEAARFGYITTILNRRSRFDLWESAETGADTPPLPYDTALLRYGRVKRAYLHKALNRRLQGSAADLMKLAMLRCWEDGIYDVTGVPRVTVHDEKGFSDIGGQDEAYAAMQRIMETCLPIRVPVRADGEIGPDWGNVVDLSSESALPYLSNL